MAALVEWEMQHQTSKYKMEPNFTWYSEVYGSVCQLWQWGRSNEAKHQYVSWCKYKENIDETGLNVYAMPFKQEEDLYRWKILILVPPEHFGLLSTE